MECDEVVKRLCYANGDQACIYIVRNGGKMEAGSRGKRGKKQTFSPGSTHQPGLKGLNYFI